jgi:hypothetical protein
MVGADRSDFPPSGNHVLPGALKPLLAVRVDLIPRIHVDHADLARNQRAEILVAEAQIGCHNYLSVRIEDKYHAEGL